MMSGNIERSAGLAIGVALGLVLAAILIRFANRGKFKTEYDERQIKARGDAYRYAFYTVVIWEAVLFILENGEIALPLSGFLLGFAGVLLGCTVLAVYCILKDAYWGLNNNRKRYGVILVIAGIFNAIPVVSALRTGGLTRGEMGPAAWLNLFVCVMLLIIGILLLVKHVQDRETEEGED